MKKAEQQTIEHIIRRMLSDRSTDAPADATKYAKDLFRLRASKSKESVIDRVMAVMRVDLAPNRAAFGERSASGGGQARQLFFDSGANAVDLRVSAVEGVFDIHGQLLGGGFENATVTIKNEQCSFIATLDVRAQFKMAQVPAGTYSFSIRSGSAEIFVEQLVLA
jgi:hypothetical protein